MDCMLHSAVKEILVEQQTELVATVTVQQGPVSFREAFWFWLKMGFISFGGPAGQIAIMHQELDRQS